ncbi:MAG: serine/threonine-protein kinase [Pirellulaceae bacterium]|nr:serine/threonine-protein kinase [Pirellulaceae bacterium]
MECPQPESLAQLLTSDCDTADDSPLWDHLETCRSCRLELDRLSDDPELVRWREAARTDRVEESELAARQAFVRSVVDNDTDADSLRAKSTSHDNGIDQRIIAALQPSTVEGELGRLGQYRILRLIGQGGMAMVFEAIDEQLERRVALKILRLGRTDADSQQRFMREARALAGVKHANVIAVYSVFEADDGLSAIAMELVEGESLQEVLKREQEIEPRQSAEWVAEVASGLDAAHSAGLIHRDIKPSNILIANSGGRRVAKLADFGLARFTSVSQKVTQSGVLLGTPSYMSPEHIAAPESCDTRSDVYSLGVTLYEMLSGEVPFRGALHTVLQRIGRDDPTPLRTLNSLIPRDLETICAKAMLRDPKARYGTAKEFAEDLQRWLADRPILARPTSKFEHMRIWCKRNRSIATALGTIAGLLLTLSAVAAYSALTIRAADKQLRIEKQTVIQTNAQLKLAADDAAKQRRIAIESLNDLVTKVQVELASRPGTLKVRESILETALKGLEEITENADSVDIDPVLIQAHIRKGEIFDLLGQTAQSVSELDKARTLAESFFESSPNSDDAKRELGNALVAQADVATRRNALDDAKVLYERVLPLRDDAAQKLPEDFNAQKSLFLVLQRLGDVHRLRNEFGKAGEYYQRSLQIAATNKEKHPEFTSASRDVSLALERSATVAMFRGETSQADAGFKQALALNQELLANDPGNKIYSGDLAYFSGNLARLASARGEHQEAIQRAQQAVEFFKIVSEADPQDTDAKMKLGGGWLTLHDVHFAAGQLEEAEKAIQTSIGIDASLSTADPTASKFAMHGAELCNILAGLQARLGKSAAATTSIKNSLRFLERCQKTADFKPELVEPMIAIQKNTLAAAELAAQGVETLTDTAGVNPELLHIARVMTMYELSRVGESKRALDIAKSMGPSQLQNPYVAHASLLIVARAYAKSYANLTQHDADASDDAKQLAEAALEGMKANLLSALSSPLVMQNPAALLAIKNDLDFAGVRELPVFLALFGLPPAKP